MAGSMWSAIAVSRMHPASAGYLDESSDKSDKVFSIPVPNYNYPSPTRDAQLEFRWRLGGSQTLSGPWSSQYGSRVRAV